MTSAKAELMIVSMVSFVIMGTQLSKRPAAFSVRIL